MIWNRLSKDDAECLASEWKNIPNLSSKTAKGLTESDEILSFEDRRLRNRIQSLFADSFSITADIRAYSGNLKFALELYDMMVREFGMTPADASDDDIWRHIQMKLVPDLVYVRWENDTDESFEKKINDNRFWKDRRRMWMKSLWWYVHLSLQNDSVEETYEILSKNNADDISQILDRPGQGGYRVELYRAIMRRYSQSSNRRANLLRNVLKLNVIQCVTVEPLLIEGGIDEYVNRLFGYFDAR